MDISLSPFCRGFCFCFCSLPRGFETASGANHLPTGIKWWAVPLPCYIDVVKTQRVAGKWPQEMTKSCRIGKNSVCLLIHPPWLALRPYWLALRPLHLALRPLQLVLRPLQLALRPLQLTHRCHQLEGPAGGGMASWRGPGASRSSPRASWRGLRVSWKGLRATQQGLRASQGEDLDPPRNVDVIWYACSYHSDRFLSIMLWTLKGPCYGPPGGQRTWLSILNIKKS